MSKKRDCLCAIIGQMGLIHCEILSNIWIVKMARQKSVSAMKDRYLYQLAENACFKFTLNEVSMAWKSQPYKSAIAFI